MTVLYKLAPNDPEVLETYAENYAHGDADKTRLYNRIIDLDPKRTGARYMLGLLTAKTDATGGIRFIEQAVLEENNDEATITYVQGLTEIMQAHGCGLPNAKTWLDKASAAYDQATNGEGDPKAMPEFKQQFLAAVHQQHCANVPAK